MSVSTTQSLVVPQNPRGIPQAPFVANVSQFIQSSTHELTLGKFQEMIGKYRFMEQHCLQRRAGLESKIPEIKKSLDLVLMIASSDQSIKTDFELADTLWVSATIPKTRIVNLWLGANVMLEYPVDEAKQLLQVKLDSATKSLIQVKEDLEFLKEQITTMEVNMARVYNDDVKLRRGKK